MGELISSIGWGAVVGGILGGITINFIWKSIRDRMHRKAVATALAVELSYLLRETKELRDMLEKGDIVLPHHSMPRAVFDLYLAEIPELLQRDNLIPDLLEVYGRVGDVTQMTKDFAEKLDSKETLSKDDWTIYRTFIDWIIVQANDLICRLELIAFNRTRTPRDRYSSMPEQLQNQAADICNTINRELEQSKESKQS